MQFPTFCQLNLGFSLFQLDPNSADFKLAVKIENKQTNNTVGNDPTQQGSEQHKSIVHFPPFPPRTNFPIAGIDYAVAENSNNDQSEAATINKRALRDPI